MLAVSATPSDPPVRVFVDASCLKQNQGGVRSYVLGLIGGLADRDDVLLTVATPHPSDLDGLAVNVVPLSKAVESPFVRALWRELWLPGLLRRSHARVVIIATHEHPVRSLDMPSVMVMYDLGPLVAPAHYGRTRWLRYLLTLPSATRRASAVVSISHATQRDLFGNVAVDRSKCRVIYSGAQALDTQVDVPSDIDGSFALYVGQLAPHKNVRTVVEAFGCDEPGLPDRFVVVGPHTPAEQAELQHFVEACGAEQRVVQLGFVSRERLAALYRDTVVGVLPSTHEGFGIPLLEAMRTGLPFVASDIPAHREVGGDDGVLYVSEIFSPTAWSTALRRASQDEELRASLGERGRARAERFSWRSLASDWRQLIDELA